MEKTKSWKEERRKRAWALNSIALGLFHALKLISGPVEVEVSEGQPRI